MKKQRLQRSLPFREGTWFAVPLDAGGFAVGRIARCTSTGEIILAYFFGPRRADIPTLNEIEDLQPHVACAVIMVGGFGLLDGTWRIVGDSEHWKREKWPIPPFIRRDPLSRNAWRVIYDDNLCDVVSEERIPFQTKGLEADGSFGHKAAEVHLSHLLNA